MHYKTGIFVDGRTIDSHKNSGFGREKGVEGLLHYTHVKSVSVYYA